MSTSSSHAEIEYNKYQIAQSSFLAAGPDKWPEQWKPEDLSNYVIWFIYYMCSVCWRKNFSASETFIHHLPVNPNRIVRLYPLHFLGPKLLNLCWIQTVTQNADNDFLDAENANGEKSNDPTPESSYLAVGRVAQPRKASKQQDC